VVCPASVKSQDTTVKNPLRRLTLSALFVVATACGGESNDPKTSDNAADLSAAGDGDDSAPASNGSETVGDGTDGSSGSSVASPPNGSAVDPDTSVSDGDEPSSSSPGGGVDPREPTGCVPDYDPSTSQGDAPCNFVSGGECFVVGADACACAGCAQADCIILESYPAQARCQ
jgi:hypothetical protein